MTNNKATKTGQGLTKVVYKPDSQSTDEYTLIVDSEEYKKYKDGDTSIALALVVESFDIFFSNQGSQGQLGKASKQQLSTVFGTSNEDEAVKKLLELGTAKPGEAIHKGFTGNDSRGGAGIDTRGSGGGVRGI